jgi:Methyltransferase domain
MKTDGFLEQFLKQLDGELELFRYAIRDLLERYGDRYHADATFILTNLARFAAPHNQTLADILRLYADYLKQLLAEYHSFAQTGRYPHLTEGELAQLFGDARFQINYLYILTLSTPLNRSRYEVFLHYRRMLAKYLKAAHSLLEIGGGNCLDALSLSAYGKVEVYERNPWSLSWLELLGLQDKIALQIADYEFADDRKYDFVAMIELLEHVSAPVAYLRGLHRVLKDGHYAYCTFAIRMPQFDHLYQFNSIADCQKLLADSGLQVVEDYCTINTHQPFAEAARWQLAADRRYAITYCCLVQKQSPHARQQLINLFNEEIEA